MTVHKRQPNTVTIKPSSFYGIGNKKHLDRDGPPTVKLPVVVTILRGFDVKKTYIYIRLLGESVHNCTLFAQSMRGCNKQNN